MALIKWRNDEDLFPSFNSMFDDFFGRDFTSRVAAGTTVPAANVTEDDDSFSIELAAPGLRKEDFNIDLDHNMVTISGQRKEEKEEKDKKKVTRREYSFTSFRRSFALPESVDPEKIRANYQDGVLHLDLPKREEARKLPPRKIEIG